METSTGLDDLAMLRAGVRFAHQVGRPPKRLDLREPAKSRWESHLGFELPSGDQAARRFGSFSKYLARMGYLPHQAGRPENNQVEEAAIAHVEGVYPALQIVRSEQNAYDAYLPTPERDVPLRTEIKGATLATRRDGDRNPFFGFKTHSRVLSKTVDRLILVGLGFDPESGLLVPLCRLEVPKSQLRLVDNKSTLMVYAGALWGSGRSQYRTFLRWREKIAMAQLPQWTRPKEDA